MKLPAFAALLAAVALFTGCDIGALDNYDQPTAKITGRVVFEGKPIGVRSNGVQLELWQPGYALNQKIPVYVGQDGTFSVVTFDGDYKLNLVPGNGPWVDKADTIAVQLKGETNIDVAVVPYYTLANENVRYANGAVLATVTVGQVNTSRAVEYVGLYLSSTTFVDRTNSLARTERQRSNIPTLNAPVDVSVALPASLAGLSAVYARVGVKTVGVAELLYSPVFKIQL